MEPLGEALVMSFDFFAGKSHQKSSKIIKNHQKSLYFLCPRSYTRFGGPMFLAFNANVVGVLRLCLHVCDSIPYLSLLFI